MSDQFPHSPAPASPPVGAREPNWTTGQGIGFLVALPGWIIVGLAGMVAAFSVGGVLGGDSGSSPFLMGAILAAAVGTIGALPGTIVFNKCKRR